MFMQRNSFVFGGKKKILALDIGTKYVGIAMSDGDKKMAFAKSTVPWDGAFSELKKALDPVFSEEQIERVVLGFPHYGLSQSKAEGQQQNKWATLIDDVKDWLVVMYKVPVVLVDERASTQEAENRLSETVDVGDLRGIRKDAIAAQIILERYLEGK